MIFFNEIILRCQSLVIGTMINLNKHIDIPNQISCLNYRELSTII